MTMDNYQIAIQSMAVIFEETNILINHLLSLLDEEGHLQDIHINKYQTITSSRQKKTHMSVNTGYTK